MSTNYDYESIKSPQFSRLFNILLNIYTVRMKMVYLMCNFCPTYLVLTDLVDAFQMPRQNIKQSHLLCSHDLL